MNFLIIITLITIVVLSLFITNKEGVRNYTINVKMDSPVSKKMLEIDPKNAYDDIRYFNNVTNLMYGYERMIG